MPQASPFSRIDTVILRVRALPEALQWYRRLLATEPVFVDGAEGLAVLPVGEDGSLTLWQRTPGEGMGTQAGRAGTFPILAVDDVDAAHAFARACGGAPVPVTPGEGVRWFGFTDPDGNYLEPARSRGPRRSRRRRITVRGGTRARHARRVARARNTRCGSCRWCSARPGR